MTRIKLVFQIPVLGPRGDVGVNLTLKCLYLHSEGNFSFDEGGGVWLLFKEAWSVFSIPTFLY